MLFLVIRPRCDPTECTNVDIFADYSISKVWEKWHYSRGRKFSF